MEAPKKVETDIPMHITTGHNDRYADVAVGRLYDAREYFLMRARAGYHQFEKEKPAAYEFRNARWKEHALTLAALADRTLREAEENGTASFPWDNFKRGKNGRGA